MNAIGYVRRVVTREDEVKIKDIIYARLVVTR